MLTYAVLVEPRNEATRNSAKLNPHLNRRLGGGSFHDLIVVDKKGGASTFTRPDRESFTSWLDEYSLGELWKKNLLGGKLAEMQEQQ